MLKSALIIDYHYFPDNSNKTKNPSSNQQNSFQEVSLLEQQEKMSTNMEEFQTYQEVL